MAALATIFNFLALNLVFVVVSLPVVTLPLAANAAMTALTRWRCEGEDRVLREFWSALRLSPPGRTTLALGVPFVALGTGVEEVHYFARGGDPLAWLCLGLGLAGLVLVMSGLGYVLVLNVRHPEVPVTQLWSACTCLAVRNLLATGPLFIAEIGAAALLALLDAPVVLIGLPVGVLQLMRLTAGVGLRRVSCAWPGTKG